MKQMAILVGVLAMACSAKAIADSTKVIPVGDWQVAVTKDSMTDEIRCIAYAQNNAVLFHSLGILTIRASSIGGYAQSQYRFDNAEPTEMKAINAAEDANWWEFWDTKKLYSSQRLRVRIINLADEEKDFDIDLRGLKKVKSVFQNQHCPR